MLGNERLQLRHDLGLSGAAKVSLEQILADSQAELLESLSLKPQRLRCEAS
jgi:hypothetical protein